MKQLMWVWCGLTLMGGMLATTYTAEAAIWTAPPLPPVLDLTRSFGTRAPWRLAITQDSEIHDPIGSNLPDDMVPGVVHICLSADTGKTCQSELQSLLGNPTDGDVFSAPHYLGAVRVERPRPDTPLLLVQVAGLHSGDGDQGVATAVLAYDRARDRFALAFAQVVGTNNNEEIRYIPSGPLRGAIVTVEPTSDAPYGYWVVVHRLLTAAHAPAHYRAVLRFRSATSYADGNPLGVIDSEMPNIEQRLGLWHPGERLPRPMTACPTPHLIHGALWCR